MALPDLIEILPLAQPVRAEITVPGSKSITNRALILAALADGEVTLTGALWSEDTQIMVECLRKLGFEIRVENDPDEFCNRTITVKGLGGKIPNGGTAEKPLELFVGNAGTAARFLSAFVCLGNGVYRLSGIPRMNERPKAALFQALRELGYRVESEKKNEKLPVVIFGRSRGNETLTEKENQRLLTSSPTIKKCTVDISESSQFASALLLCAKVGGWKIEIVGENAEESPYVAMTLKLIETFPHRGGKFQIEPDASSGSYFWGIHWLLIKNATTENSRISVNYWPNSGMQIDEMFPQIWPLPDRNWPKLQLKVSREDQLGDSIMTAIVLAPFAPMVFYQDDVTSNIFTNLARLRLQETERVVALRTELEKCGVRIIENKEKHELEVFPFKNFGAELKLDVTIETYNDHRMAMCFAILGLKVPGIKIKNPACVKKTFPNFFQKLATPPPKGLGATILNARTGKKLTHEELFAD